MLFRSIHHINIPIEGLWICRLAGSEQRIHRRESPVPVLVHPRLGEIELGFVVLLIAGELLPDAVVDRIQMDRPETAVIRDWFAKGEKIPPGLHLPQLGRDYPRAAEMIRRSCSLQKASAKAASSRPHRR